MKSVLVLGIGRLGRHFAKQMQNSGNDVMVVDRHKERVEEYSSEFTDALVADCTSENVIQALDVSRFDLCFVTIGDNFENSLITTSLLKKHGAKHVLARAKQDIQAELLRTIGADEIIYPEKDVAENLAVRYSDENIFDYIELSQGFSIYETSILPAWEGHTLIELDIRKKHHINIIAVKNGSIFNPVPAADYRFKANDHIMVIGKSKDVLTLTKHMPKQN